MKKALLFLCVHFLSIVSMNSAIRWSCIFGGTVVALHAQSQWANNNNYNDLLDTFKQQFKDAWEKENDKVQIGNNPKNNYDWLIEDLIDRRKNLINYFVYALKADCGIRFTPLKELVNEKRINIQYIHNSKGVYSKYKYEYEYDDGEPLTLSNNAHMDKSSPTVIDFVNVDLSNYNEEEILKELELVKNQIVMPLFEDKKSQVSAYIIGCGGLGLFLLGCFYKKIFSLK